MNICRGLKKAQLECRMKSAEMNKKESRSVSQPNIDYIMNMTKEYLNGKIDVIDYSLDFPHELDQRYRKMHRENDDYCDLIYESLYEEGVYRFNEVSDTEFKKLIRKKYNYIKKIE